MQRFMVDLVSRGRVPGRVHFVWCGVAESARDAIVQAMARFGFEDASRLVRVHVKEA
jgi:hypothetical protein